uniref:Uncharacterized protein n=1 Tax=Cacopsylla melanoneura TaxID=428564 RepID=A0A8D9FAK8_9HEMI
MDLHTVLSFDLEHQLVTFMVWRSVQTLSSHLIFGLPRLLVLYTLAFITFFGMRESSIRCICPYHSILRALINRTMSWCSRMPFISALYLILHSLFIFTPPYIFRIILLSNLLNLSLSASVSVHVSPP